MKYLIPLLSLLIATAFTSDNLPPDLKEKDVQALLEWVNTKRQVTVKEKGGHLSLSGEVRTELQSTREKKDGVQQRGYDGEKETVPTRAWDVEINLVLNYKTNRTWLESKIKFDNDSGLEKGTLNKLSIERAFLGGRIVNGDTYTMDLEIGRRYLAYTFDSKVMYGSLMDGILYKYDQSFDKTGDFYFHGGPFLVNEMVGQYAYVGELGLLNIARTGLYSKLASVYWDTKHTAEKTRNAAFRFVPIQMIVGYKLKGLNTIFTFYGAGLYNARAQRTAVSYNKRKGWAWYTGFSVGELREQWDWSLDINYQWVELQAIPDFDGIGIGRGNALKRGLYSKNTYGKGEIAKQGEGVGAGNYKGISIELLYLLTKNITIYQSWKQSVNQDSHIKPTFNYKQYEIEIIYNF